MSLKALVSREHAYDRAEGELKQLTPYAGSSKAGSSRGRASAGEGAARGAAEAPRRQAAHYAEEDPGAGITGGTGVLGKG